MLFFQRRDTERGQAADTSAGHDVEAGRAGGRTSSQTGAVSATPTI